MRFFNLFKRHKKPAKSIKALWDAASMSVDMRRHFRGADNLTADQSLGQFTRRTIASRVRFEAENNSFCAGIVSTLASACVGRGVNIELEPANLSNNVDHKKVRKAMDAREERFRAWANIVRLNRLLTLCRRARCIDGETFILLCNNPNLAGECKLQPVQYEASQIRGDYELEPKTDDAGNITEWDGIRFDRYGNPAQYQIFPASDNYGNYGGKGKWYPAANVLHYANLLRPGQHRGVSELASSISVFNDLRRFSNATLAAAEAAAELSFIIKTDLTSIDEDGNRIATAIEPGTFLEAARGGGMALPEGWDLKQLQAANPSSNYPQYLESKIREAARCLDMPLMVALSDSSNANYSSSRADRQTWGRKIDADRVEMVQEILSPLYSWWCEYDRAAHPADYAYDATPQWQWQPWLSIDPVKDDNAARIRLESGTTTLRDECAVRGLDWEAVLYQRAREKELAQQLGLNVREPATQQQLDELYKEAKEND